MRKVFSGIIRAGFDVAYTYHADAILHQHFRDAADELDGLVGEISVPIDELVRGGGGEAPLTQRLRKSLAAKGWTKETFRVEKRINDRTTFSQSHEVDHVKRFPHGTIGLEIEWNNKDPFFDRDLENFNRLHADGAIDVALIVTRGQTLQVGIERAIRDFAVRIEAESFTDLERHGVQPTQRQRKAVELYMQRSGRRFAEAWAACFTSDKFGAATTHWAKLKARLDRGVGSPCPIVGIGIPLSRITRASPADRPR